MSKEQLISDVISDTVADLLVCDELEDALKAGEITIEELVNAFRQELTNILPARLAPEVPLAPKHTAKNYHMVLNEKFGPDNYVLTVTSTDEGDKLSIDIKEGTCDDLRDIGEFFMAMFPLTMDYSVTMVPESSWPQRTDKEVCQHFPGHEKFHTTMQAHFGLDNYHVDVISDGVFCENRIVVKIKQSVCPDATKSYTNTSEFVRMLLPRHQKEWAHLILIVHASQWEDETE